MQREELTPATHVPQELSYETAVVNIAGGVHEQLREYPQWRDRLLRILITEMGAPTDVLPAPAASDASWIDDDMQATSNHRAAPKAKTAPRQS